MSKKSKHSLPEFYRWLEDTPKPKMLEEGLKLFGVKETPGDASNPQILEWANECGITNYKTDSIPWCGLYLAIVCKLADKEPVFAPLWARNWRSFGQRAEAAKLGDVLVFMRGLSGGHVGLYVGEDGQAYHVLGGNQSDRVRIDRIAKNRLIAARKPKWKIAEPQSRVKIFLSATGQLSKDEA